MTCLTKNKQCQTFVQQFFNKNVLEKFCFSELYSHSQNERHVKNLKSSDTITGTYSQYNQNCIWDTISNYITMQIQRNTSYLK